MDAERPTLLLDESDAAFNGEKEYAEALRGLLNTGHRRSGKGVRPERRRPKADRHERPQVLAKAGLHGLRPCVGDNSLVASVVTASASLRARATSRRSVASVTSSRRRRSSGTEDSFRVAMAR